MRTTRLQMWGRWGLLGLLLIGGHGAETSGDVGQGNLEQAIKSLTLDLGDGVTMDLVLIRPGTFMMGSESGDDDEKPVHKVAISKPFYMGKTEVTQAQWEAIMGVNPSHFKDPNCPVENVSWGDCRTFLRKLGEKVDRAAKFHLPTEAQWEYACRAGSTGKFCHGDDKAGLGEYAWFFGNARDQTHPVARKKPNAWGLYDMHGNVWEWCADGQRTYVPQEVKDPVGPDDSDRVLRGGSWINLAATSRSALRLKLDPGFRYANVGFRVVLEPPE